MVYCSPIASAYTTLCALHSLKPLSSTLFQKLVYSKHVTHSPFTCRHRLGYLQDLANYLDLASIFSPLLLIPFRVTNLDTQWVFASLAFLFVGLKMFKYVTAFR